MLKNITKMRLMRYRMMKNRIHNTGGKKEECNILLFLVYFQVPTIILMCIDLLDLQNAKKKTKTHLNFSTKLRLI